MIDWGVSSLAKISERVSVAVRVNKAAVMSRGCAPWRLPVTMRRAEGSDLDNREIK